MNQTQYCLESSRHRNVPVLILLIYNVNKYLRMQIIILNYTCELHKKSLFLCLISTEYWIRSRNLNFT